MLFEQVKLSAASPANQDDYTRIATLAKYPSCTVKDY